MFTLLLLIDPYDSARFPTLGIVGIDDHNPRMANVSRGRDPAFDGAVFGNSTGQLIDPHRIGPPTGLSFTQLTVPATGPREQLAMMGWFASHHDKIGAFILVADNSWCAQSPDLQVTHPFPFWLYGGDRDYVAHVLNSKSLDRAVWRVQLAFGMRPRTDPVGYSDYTAGKNFTFVPQVPEPAEDLSVAKFPLQFPWIDRLRDQIARLPPEASVVIVVPPIYAPLLEPAEQRWGLGRNGVQIHAGRLQWPVGTAARFWISALTTLSPAIPATSPTVCITATMSHGRLRNGLSPRCVPPPSEQRRCADGCSTAPKRQLDAAGGRAQRIATTKQ